MVLGRQGRVSYRSFAGYSPTAVPLSQATSKAKARRASISIALKAPLVSERSANINRLTCSLPHRLCSPQFFDLRR